MYLDCVNVIWLTMNGNFIVPQYWQVSFGQLRSNYALPHPLSQKGLSIARGPLSLEFHRHYPSCAGECFPLACCIWITGSPPDQQSSERPVDCDPP